MGNKGLKDQLSSNNKKYYDNFNIDEFVDYCFKLTTEDLSKTNETFERRFIFHTGKQGAIEAYIAAYEYTDPSEEDIKEYREQLEKELKEGIYRVSDYGLDFVKYLG